MAELDPTEIQMSVGNGDSPAVKITNPKNVRIDMTEEYQEEEADDQDEVAQIEATRHLLDNTNAWFFE